MADEEKSFPASAFKLARLRESGIFPISKQLGRTARYLGCLFAISYLCLVGFSNFKNIFRESFATAGTKPSTQSAINEIVQRDLVRVSTTFMESLFILLFPVIILVVLVGLYQSRFHFSFRMGRSRMFQLVSPQEWFSASRFVTALVLGGLGVGWIYGISSLFTELSRNAFNTAFALVTSLESAARESFSVGLLPVLYFGATCILALGVLSRVIVVLRFHLDQRMARSEVEAEIRETEGSPEMKRAMTERI